MLVPDSASVPLPVLVRPPGVPPLSVMLPDSASVPVSTWIVPPPVPSPTARADEKPAVVSRVPPVKVRPPEAAPRLAFDETAIVPPPKTVPPL